MYILQYIYLYMVMKKTTYGQIMHSVNQAFIQENQHVNLYVNVKLFLYE